MAESEIMKREMRKLKNRESAERNRKEKNDSIEILQSQLIKLSSDVHELAVDNWYLRRDSSLENLREEFPVYTPPILEPAVEDGCGVQVEKILPTSEYANVPRPSRLSLDKESCKKRRLERMEVMKRKRQRSGSICGDSLSSVSCSSADSVSTVSTVSSIFLTKDEIRRKKNRESAERSRLRKLRLIDNLASQVTALREKQVFLKRENASLRAASVAPPTTAPSRARSARITLCSPEVVDAKAKNYLDDSSDASPLSSSSNSPYHATSFPALSLGLSARCLPSTAYRIQSAAANGGGGTDDQLYAMYSSSSEDVTPIAAPTVEYSFDELFDFKDLCDFDFSGLECISAI